MCVRRRVALATPRGHAVWDLSTYPTGPAHRYRQPHAPPVSALFSVLMILITLIMFLVAYDDIIALMMILVAYALEDEPAEESVDHRMGRGA